MTQELLDATRPAGSSRVINFDSAEVVPGIVPETFFLVVRGEAPCLNMSVALTPLIYVKCPEYWGIEVVGSLPGGFCLTAIKPFLLTIPLSGITGSKGIEVIGASRQEKFEVGGGCS